MQWAYLVDGGTKAGALRAVKRILRYIKGNLNSGLRYTSSKDSRLVGYTDSDYVEDPDEVKSTSAYMFIIGSAAFSWSPKEAVNYSTLIL